jgi:divalent metal cation (Fe/Co/Zn/Cd) transporter
MKLKDQVMFANLAIFGAMVVAYFQGYPIPYIAACGVLAFILVSAFFFYRIRKARKQQ